MNFIRGENDVAQTRPRLADISGRGDIFQQGLRLQDLIVQRFTTVSQPIQPLDGAFSSAGQSRVMRLASFIASMATIRCSSSRVPEVPRSSCCDRRWERQRRVVEQLEKNHRRCSARSADRATAAAWNSP